MRHFHSGEIYHVFNKSIANFAIFGSNQNKKRFIETIDYYNNKFLLECFSEALRRKKYFYNNLLDKKENSLIKIISFCVMPDHYHLLVKMLEDEIFSKYINDIENSYTRYFNNKIKRKGPLWQSQFKSVKINGNEQLLHVLRYVNLNPTTSSLVNRPEDWEFSSYRDLIKDKLKEIPEISIQNKKSLIRFVSDQIDYQKKLKEIKKQLID